MKSNAGTKPPPSRNTNRIRAPRVIAIVSSGISLIIVVGYFHFFYVKGIGVKNEITYISLTPERTAESMITAIFENRTQRALKLSKGSAREAVLDGSIFRRITRTERFANRNSRLEETGFRQPVDTSNSANVSQESVESTSVVTKTESITAHERSTEKQEPFPNRELIKAESKAHNRNYLSPEPLLFSIHESHREKNNRILLVGTLKGKNTDRVYLSNIHVTTEKRNSRWYVTRIRFM